MKKIFISSIAICLISFCNSQAQSTNLNGLWADSAGTSLKNAYAIISQEGDKIYFSHYLEFNGKPFVEHGEGHIIGNKIAYKVDVSLPIEGWATSGLHQLTVSADGKTLRGTYTDNKGNTGPIVLKKK